MQRGFSDIVDVPNERLCQGDGLLQRPMFCSGVAPCTPSADDGSRPDPLPTACCCISEHPLSCIGCSPSVRGIAAECRHCGRCRVVQPLRMDRNRIPLLRGFITAPHRVSCESIILPWVVSSMVEWLARRHLPCPPVHSGLPASGLPPAKRRPPYFY